MAQNPVNTSNLTQPKALQALSIPVPVQLAQDLSQDLGRLGVSAAIFVQQIHYWMCNGVGQIFKGIRWVYNSYEKWCSQLPWLSDYTFRQIRSKLIDLGIIRVEQLGLRHDGRDRSCWYTINYEHEYLVGTCSQLSDGAGEHTHPDHPVNSSPDVIETETTPKSLEKTTNTAVAALSNLGNTGTPPELPQSTPSLESPAPNENDSLSQENPEAALIIESVAAAGIQMNATLIALVLKYTLAEVLGALAYYQERKAAGKVNDPPAWFTRCLQSKWWEKSATEGGAIVAVSPIADVDWTQDSDWEDWVEFMREQGIGGFIERGQWRNVDDRRAIANWASHRNLIWGEDDV